MTVKTISAISSKVTDEHLAKLAYVSHVRQSSLELGTPSWGKYGTAV